MYQSTLAADTVGQNKAPVEWYDDVKVILSIPGHYMLANRRNAKGERCRFTCRIVNVSPDHMVLAAPVLGQLAERVIVYSEPLGRLHGMITRLISDGFVMSIATSSQSREILIGKLGWLAKQKDAPEVPDSRRHARIVPRNPSGTILLADGSIISCLVMDFSISGVAISADFHPKVGTPLAVGKMVGRVVRCFTEGFAVQFLTYESLAQVEHKLRASPK
jgi:hypothetical protein